jgi:ligand-binding SRPBCC domain-containing protein
MARELVFRSTLAAPADEVWRHARTLEGVNWELFPFVRMSRPPEARGRSLEEAPLGEPAFASWLLAFGGIPFDRHRLTLARVEPGRAFAERSHSWLQRAWDHDRTVEPGPHGTVVTDRVRAEPRVKGALPGVEALVRGLFRWRHRRLRKRFGVAEDADGGGLS